MAVIREKNLLDPQKRIDELNNQIVVLAAEMVLVETLRDQDKLRGMGFRKWNLVRHLGYWEEIVEHQNTEDTCGRGKRMTSMSVFARF